jgi:probable F420-dependent oxidoreductase
MDLPLDNRLSIGVQTIHRRTEPATGPWLPTIDEMRSLVELVDRCSYDSLWVGDHISFPLAIFDPLLQLAQAAVVSRRLVFGTGVYLLPLRHPTPVAKQVSTLDHLTEGRFIFGVGVGGEFPKEYEACGVPIKERGARLTESLVVMRKLWSGEPASHNGRFFNFEGVKMQPPPRQPGGPPIWCGGRSDAALRRTGRLTDGWMSYVVTPDMFRQGLEKIATAASEAARTFDRSFGTAHLLFTRIDDTYEKALDAATVSLSQRYAMDFRKAAERYCALGPPQQVVETIFKFQQAGVRHIILDFVGPYEERDSQIERFAVEAMPMLAGLRGRR